MHARFDMCMHMCMDVCADVSLDTCHTLGGVCSSSDVRDDADAVRHIRRVSKSDGDDGDSSSARPSISDDDGDDDSSLIQSLRRAGMFVHLTMHMSIRMHAHR